MQAGCMGSAVRIGGAGTYVSLAAAAAGRVLALPKSNSLAQCGDRPAGQVHAVNIPPPEVRSVMNSPPLRLSVQDPYWPSISTKFQALAANISQWVIGFMARPSMLPGSRDQCLV